MTWLKSNRLGWAARSLVLAVAAGASGVIAASPQAAQQKPTFRSAVDIVSLNVVVRDKSGAIVRGLTREDFVVLEDGRAQSVTTFGFEEVQTQPMAPLPDMPTVLGSVGRAANAPAKAAAAPPQPVPFDASGRRLIVLFFDLGSMQPEELQRALESARDYVTSRLTPADTMAIVTLSTSLAVQLDFTSDRDALLGTIDRMSGVEGLGFEEPVLDPEAEAETGFAADDSEFTVFNTDRRLEALKLVAESLSGIEQRKSLVYFSSGMTQAGLDNRVAIRGVIDRAVRANLSIYAADMRGLQAMPAGGDAAQASTRGVAAFSGRSVSRRFEQMAASQDALSTLAEDTGGRAFFDQNDLDGVFERIVADTSAYYILGYSSTNPQQDGRFRRVRVRVKRPDVRLEYRAGYYAPRDFAHSGREDRELQLVEQMMSDLSVTDLPVYAASAYFREKDNRYFVPVWLVVPGSELRFARAGSKEKATLDLFGVMRDEQGRPVGRMRDTIDLAVAATEGVQQKNVQYQTDFTLPPGAYRLKVVVRENQTGTMGSFETLIAVPNLERDTLKVSSVVIGTQFQDNVKANARNPLISEGRQLLANVARVVSPGQQLHFYYEMYDPVQAPAASATGGAAGDRPGQAVRVLSNVVFFQGRRRVYETPLLAASALTAPNRKATAFQLQVPVSDLEPGLYTCQVNVIDDVGGTFGFPRLALYVRPK